VSRLGLINFSTFFFELEQGVFFFSIHIQIHLILLLVLEVLPNLLARENTSLALSIPLLDLEHT
jgi:hypothetical protein